MFGQATGPMENMNYTPEKLTFDMHRKDGSLVSFRVELVDAGHGRLAAHPLHITVCASPRT